MSSEKVTQFLEEKQASEIQRKNTELAQHRYEILSHYNLGEKILYKEGDNIDDYPFTKALYDQFTGEIKKERFRYDCDISDEDFEKVSKIYTQEIKSNEQKQNSQELDDSAEKTLKTIAIITLVLGIVTFFICFIVAATADYGFEWGAFGHGIGVLIASIVSWAFTRVFVNISIKLNKLNK